VRVVSHVFIMEVERGIKQGRDNALHLGEFARLEFKEFVEQLLVVYQDFFDIVKDLIHEHVSALFGDDGRVAFAYGLQEELIKEV
jgi:hypothetical protein